MRVGSWTLWTTVVAILAEAVMAIHFWRTRDRFRGGRWFVVALTMAMLAAVCFLGQLLAAGRAGAVFWSQATGIAGLGALFGIFGFAVTYTHREWVLRSRWFAGLAGALVAVFLLRLTNDLPGWPGVHQLWAVDARTTTRGGYRLVDVTAGPLWAAYTAVVVVMLLVLIALVVEFTFRPSQRLYRRRNTVVALGVATPAVAAIAGQTVAAGFELTVPGVAVSLVLIGAALSRFGALEAVPIARTGIVDEIDGGVVVFDDRERVVDVTTRAREILDCPDESLGAPLSTLLDGRFADLNAGSDDLPARLDGRTFALAGDAHGEGREDGNGPRYVETRVSTLTDRSGNRLSRALLLYDVTERVERERELEQKNEFLDEFASVVSHDIATPLGIVQNKARLVELTGDPDHAEDIHEAAERVQALVDELRLLAGQGSGVSETAPVDLDTAAEAAWHPIDAPAARLVVESTPTVAANRQLFVQALRNLFENAVTHGTPDRHDDGAVESAVSDDLTVRVGALADGFFVADDGRGIPATDRDRVFEQGFTTAAEGSGLGLAVVRLVADAHDWSVTVTDSDDGGARFEFTGVRDEA